MIGKVPITQQRIDLHNKRSIRGIVFGLQDGILTVLGILTGVDAATNIHTTLIAAIIAGIVGTVSMGVGEWLGCNAEDDVITSTIKEEKLSFKLDPVGEFEDQVQFMITKGFNERQAREYTRIIQISPDIYLAEMLHDKYGIDIADITPHSSIIDGYIIAIAHAVGAIIPILAYLITPHTIVYPVILSVLSLGIIGVLSARISKSNPCKKAIELMLVGIVLCGVSISGGMLLTHIH